MKIMPLNTQQNQQPNFNGYVDKSIVKIIKKATKAEIKNIYNYANKYGCPISQEKLNKTLDTSSSILKNLNDYMSNFKKDTYLTLGSLEDKDSFVLKNKRLKNTTYLHNKVFESYHRKIYSEDLDYKCSSESILSAILDFTQNLKPEMAERIERRVFIKFAQNSDIFFPMRRAKKADKLAQEFNAEGGWVEKLKNDKKSKKLQKLQNKMRLKEVGIKNKEIYKEALKKSDY